jgi:hypothetical protein
VAGLAGVAAAIAIVGGIFAKSSQSDAQSEARFTKPQQAQAPAAPPPDTNVTLSKQVALAVVPSEAHIFQGDKDLGTSPVILEVEEGKTVTLNLRMDGYEELELTLDGSKPRESVKLKKLVSRAAHVPQRLQPKKAAADPRADAKSKKKPGMGGGEIVNPWD